MRTARSGISTNDHARRSVELANAIVATSKWGDAHVVMLFVGIKFEPDTRPLIDAAISAGKRVVLPRVHEGDLVVLPYTGTQFEISPFGVPEPALGAPIEISTIDLVIVPGLAFDDNGFRVGYGGGFYDRFLPRLRPGVFSIGIGFVEQHADAIPRDEHDVALTSVVLV